MSEAGASYNLIAVDIGNSRMKLGDFKMQPFAAASLPEPLATFELPVAHETGALDLKQLAAWCERHSTPDTRWTIASVHRAAADLLSSAIDRERRKDVSWPIRRLTYRDVPLAIRVEQPERVGIDRLVAAAAADRLRKPDRAAIIVDLGTATTVDLLEADGAFAGGAILPGIAMSARALAEQTDALPHVTTQHLEKVPTPIGKSTEGAIQSGLYWGTVGAIRELITRLSAKLTAPPEVFVTGGASRQIVEALAERGAVHHVPHLVLAGIAFLDAQSAAKADG